MRYGPIDLAVVGGEITNTDPESGDVVSTEEDWFALLDVEVTKAIDVEFEVAGSSARLVLADGADALISAALAVIDGELLNGLRSISTAAILPFVGVEVMVTLAWLGVRQTGRQRLSGLPHYLLSLAIGTGLTLLVTNPDTAQMSLESGLALTLLVSLIIDAVSTATDKADLLSRLGPG